MKMIIIFGVIHSLLHWLLFKHRGFSSSCRDPAALLIFFGILEGSPWGSAQTVLKRFLPSLSVACHTKRRGKTNGEGWEKSNVSGVSEVCDSFGFLGWVFKFSRLLTAKWDLSKRCVCMIFHDEQFVSGGIFCVCVLVMVCIWLIIYPLSSSHTLCHRLIPGIDRLDPRTLSGRDQPLSTVVLPHPDSQRPQHPAGSSNESMMRPGFMVSSSVVVWSSTTWSSILVNLFLVR